MSCPSLGLAGTPAEVTESPAKSSLYTQSANPQSIPRGSVGDRAKNPALGGGRIAAAEGNLERRLLEAISRSQTYLLGQQHDPGYWVGEFDCGTPTLVADTIAYHHWNGKVDLEWQRKAVNHIFSMQLPDGGWKYLLRGAA